MIALKEKYISESVKFPFIPIETQLGDQCSEAEHTNNQGDYQKRPG